MTVRAFMKMFLQLSRLWCRGGSQSTAQSWEIGVKLHNVGYTGAGECSQGCQE